LGRASITRRSCLAGLAGAFAAGVATPVHANSPQCPAVPPPPTSLPPLRGVPLGELARAKGIALGTQVDQPFDGSYGRALYDPVYRALVEREQFTYLSYGSSFGFGPLCPDPPDADGSLSFASKKWKLSDTWFLANDITTFARQGRMRGRADALIWNSTDTAPPWLKPLPAGELAARPGKELTSNLVFMRKFVSAASRKILELQAGDPDFFQAVGVVNEPIVAEGPRPVFRSGPLLPPNVEVIGYPGVPDYIRQAFREAEAANARWAEQLGVPASRAKLFINNAEGGDDQFGAWHRPAILSLVEAMLKEGLPLGAVGLECHLQPQMMSDPSKPDWRGLVALIDAIGALGVDVYITELDVLDYEASCHGARATPAASDELTKLYFGTFFDQVLRAKAVKSICFWDLSDRYSVYRRGDVSAWWGYDQLPRSVSPVWPKCPRLPPDRTAIACPRPNPYDDAYMPKSAWAVMAEALRAAPGR